VNVLEHHACRAAIAPVAEGVPRPLWSVMIPTYNCAIYLRETLASVLVQDPGPDIMQIEVVDDFSTRDDPSSIVAELGQGRIGFYRQKEHVGYIGNFTTCLNRSRGKLVHLLHGDDCVREGFYRKMQGAFDEHPEIGAAFCRHILMDERGHWQVITWLEQSESGILRNWLERIAVQQRIQTPSIVARRSVYENLGGFDRCLSCYGEDWEMWIRIAAHYPIWYEVEPLALYRMHSASLSRQAARTGADIRDLRRVIGIVQSYLPIYLPCASQYLRKAREGIALDALDCARRMLSKQDSAAAMAQIRGALKCSHSPRVIKQIVRLLTRAGAHRTRRMVRMATSIRRQRRAAEQRLET